MKAMVYKNYGDSSQLKLLEVTKPSPKDDEILVQIKATSLNAADKHLLQGKPFLVRLQYGLFAPNKQILGADVAGVVTQVGNNVQTFRVGDEVFADLSGAGLGGFAEFVAAKATAFCKKPANLGFGQAAAVPLAAVTALQALHKGKIASAQNVLILGASGGVGTFAVQLAKAFGAHVTAVCSTHKLEQTRRLGADEVLDYTTTDVLKSGKKFDLILDIAAQKSFRLFASILSQEGAYVVVGGAVSRILHMMIFGGMFSRVGGQQFAGLMAQSKTADLETLKNLLESGKIAPMIEKTYALEQLPEAMTHLGTGRAAGKLVVML
jgi:2-desacetyl-2-hydroxyethyl bacteriochlorophyllide A dehydrogenase